MTVLVWSLAPAIGAAELPGLTVEAPAGADWYQVQRNASSLVWMRRVPDAGATFGVAVLTQSLAREFEVPEQFAAWVRGIKEENPDPARYGLTVSRLEPAPEIARYCVRYQVAIDDRAAGAQGVMELRVAGLACLHPDAPNRYYDVQYSSRSPSARGLPNSIVTEGRNFVDSFRFERAPPDGNWALGEHAPARLERDAT